MFPHQHPSFAKPSPSTFTLHYPPFTTSSPSTLYRILVIHLYHIITIHPLPHHHHPPFTASSSPFTASLSPSVYHIHTTHPLPYPYNPPFTTSLPLAHSTSLKSTFYHICTIYLLLLTIYPLPHHYHPPFTTQSQATTPTIHLCHPPFTTYTSHSALYQSPLLHLVTLNCISSLTTLYHTLITFTTCQLPSSMHHSFFSQPLPLFSTATLPHYNKQLSQYLHKQIFTKFTSHNHTNHPIPYSHYKLILVMLSVFISYIILHM